MDYSLIAAFVLGLSSAVHCMAMCGGISGALTLSLHEGDRENQWKTISYVFTYNIGRILSYAVAGAVVGGLGQTLFTTISPKHGHMILRIVAAIVMVGMGLYLAGWFSRLAFIETLGLPLWRRLEPIGRRFIPARTLLSALLFGAIWGWLPCGLVYSALILTASSGGTSDGALFMLFFGVGTLPAVMTAGIITGTMARLAKMPYVRQLAGGVIIIMGIASLLYTGNEHYGE